LGRTHGTPCSAGNFGLAELGVCALSKTYPEQLAIGELISRPSFRDPTLNPITPPGVLPTQAGGARSCAAVNYELTGSYAAAVIAATIGTSAGNYAAAYFTAVRWSYRGQAGRCGCSSPTVLPPAIAVELGPAEAIDSVEKTEFAGISTVPPGCYAIARDGDVRIYPYWDWEIPTAEQMRADTRSDAEIVDEFR